MSINSKLNSKLFITHDHRHTIRMEAFRKQILKKYLQGEFNYTKNQGTYPTCLDYHPSGQIIY